MSKQHTQHALLAQIKHAMSVDQYRLRRRLLALLKTPEHEQQLLQWQQDLEKSCSQVVNRRLSIPSIRYDDSLPIAERREDIKDALNKHQVLIIAGETGSGKTTQLPKLCLELGRGTQGLIGHTQPRRLAARSVAARIAEELATPLGELVGYQVRYEDQSHERTLIKLMTDGILLAETGRDRFLQRYDTIIIDEAHERSLNIDFLLGYIKQILPRRPDLKVIITSATIDLERFSKHFDNAPIIEVSGRTYPVDTWYRPLVATQDEDGNSVEEDLSVDQGILNSLIDIAEHERSEKRLPGDVLVFLPGEREIRDCAEVLRKAQLKHTEILPLYARLSPSEQQKIFQSSPARKVILATNVAETSLTVPGIRYVIDSGTARISRYSYRAKIQRLPIEAISRASANQRQGRCGRVEAGICIRLYSEADYLGRPEFTDPEILRTNLAAVILQMLHLRLGAIEDFPFIEPPEGKAISDGFNVLQELSAVDRDSLLTPLGKQLARLPIDPRVGRMLLAAAEQGSLREMLIVASALSIQDARERPADKQQAADQAHAQWKDPDSDFAVLINIWRSFEEQRLALGSSGVRRWCRTHFLNYLRMREWRDAHRQLTLICRELQLPFNQQPSDYAQLHKALLTGLLSQIGQKTEENDFLGARQRRFHIHPSSTLGRKRPQWLMAAELVETTKLFARLVAKIEPEWAEQLAEHLLKRTHLEPHWEKRRGQVVAYEQISLYGLIIIGRRAVHYGPIDPVLSRETFIREGLVANEILSRAHCLQANRELLKTLDKLEAKARRRDILADEETLFSYYAQHIPADIYQTASFDRWYKRSCESDPQLLLMTEADVLAREATEVTANQYPDVLEWQGIQLPLSYHFEPGHSRDGVTVTIPAPLLAQIPESLLQWLVPGMLTTRCIALVRELPKAVRKNFVPVPDFIGAALEGMPFAQGSLTETLGQQLLRMTGVRVSEELWQQAVEQLDEHLQMNIEVVDADGKRLGEGRDLAELRSRFAGASQQALSELQQSKATPHTVASDSFTVQAQSTHKVAGMAMTVYPALVDNAGEVQEGRFSTQQQADQEHRRALQRLLLQQVAEPAKYLRSRLPGLTEMSLLYRDLGRVEALTEDILLAAVDRCMLQDLKVLPRDAQAVAQLAESKRGEFVAVAEHLAKTVLIVLQRWHEIKKRLKGRIDLSMAVALNDIKAQLASLLYAGFVRDTPAVWLQEYPRFLKAIEQRLDKLPSQVQQDRVWTVELSSYLDKLNKRENKHKQEGKYDEALSLYRWMLEEYRVSLFAQQLGTKVPVSDKRLSKQWSLVED
ncbi:ATP-dependent RNA helicase HrpA [Denitrificimonas caeni]|uniref:ATP-dependent RNA helicase HrpA n=1 Tax=Denitrificimonas caeni TaxID=521720 RepID=UPI00196305D4|nr:ATP-dependent RNA helicase HrpA [Denitrificimonas caeni]